MARIRSVKPEFFKHEGLADLDKRQSIGGTPSFIHRYVFEGLWGQADREGRLRDRPRTLHLDIAPWDEFDFDDVLWSLHDAGFIVRYDVDGESYIWIPKLKEHQKFHVREPESTLPPPPKGAKKRRPGTTQGDAAPGAGLVPSTALQGAETTVENHSEPVQGDAEPPPGPLPAPVRPGRKGREGSGNGKGAETAPAPVPGWDPILLAELHQAMDRKLLEPNDREWQDFVISTLEFPPEQREAAVREYLTRKHPPGSHGLGYVLKMIHDGAGTRRIPSNGNGGANNGNQSAVPKWKQQGASSAEEYEAWQGGAPHG